MPTFWNGFQAGIYYVQESAEGTSPNSAAYLHLAHKTEVTVMQDSNPVGVPLSGSRDFAGYGKGIDNPVITFTFKPSKGSGAAFLKNFLDTDNSFTLLLMIDDTVDTIFARVPGCKIKSVSTKAAIYPERQEMEVSVEVWGWTFLFTQSSGSPTFEAPPATFVNWSDVTIKREGSTVTDWWDFSFDVDYSLFRNRNHQGVTTGITRGRRQVTGTWTRTSSDSRLGNAELEESRLATPIDLEFVVAAIATSDRYLFTDSVYPRVPITHSIDEQVGITHEFRAATFSIVSA